MAFLPELGALILMHGRRVRTHEFAYNRSWLLRAMLGLGLVALAGVFRPLWFHFDSRVAISAYCSYSHLSNLVPLPDGDMAASLDIPLAQARLVRSRHWENSLHGSDPWGHGWVVEDVGGGLWPARSVGPNGVDEQGGGDDRLVLGPFLTHVFWLGPRVLCSIAFVQLALCGVARLGVRRQEFLWSALVLLLLALVFVWHWSTALEAGPFGSRLAAFLAVVTVWCLFAWSCASAWRDWARSRGPGDASSSLPEQLDTE